jgi:hypothetical protein
MRECYQQCAGPLSFIIKMKQINYKETMEECLKEVRAIKEQLKLVLQGINEFEKTHKSKDMKSESYKKGKEALSKLRSRN